MFCSDYILETMLKCLRSFGALLVSLLLDINVFFVGMQCRKNSKIFMLFKIVINVLYFEIQS